MIVIKYLIIGAGGIGGSIGAFLSRADKDVTFIARGEHLDKMRRDGLVVLSDIFGEFTIHNVKVKTQEEYNSKPDVIFVCVKGYGLSGIKNLLIKASDNKTIIIPLLNGLNIGGKIQNIINIKTNVLDGCLYLHGCISSPGKIKQIGKSNKIIFGTRSDNSCDMSILKQIQRDLIDSGMNAVISDNISSDIFKKFACNASFGVCGAYYNITTGQMKTEGIYRSTAIEMLNELAALAKAQGVLFEEDLIKTSLGFIDGFVSDSVSSFQRDIQLKRQSEVDTLVFDVVRNCRAYGVNAPVFEKIAKYFGFENK